MNECLRRFALLFAVALPCLAFAEDTRTFINKTNRDQKIVHGEHACIHHPSYFDKVVPANSQIQVHAKWMDDCATFSDEHGHIVVILEANDSYPENKVELFKGDGDDSKFICITNEVTGTHINLCPES